MSKVLMIFVDGVGIGENDSSKNIFFQRDFKFLKNIFGEVPHLNNQKIEKNGRYLFPNDACLSVDDLPQSGTGQTSIFCGINAPKILGRHFGPYPHSSLVPQIQKLNIFKSLLDLNKKVTFANAYPKVFFDYIASGRKRLSVTSLSCLLSNVPLKNEENLKNGYALSAEIDNSRWVKKLNYDLPIITPQLAAQRLLKLSDENDFTLFEFFYTDHIGHFRIKDVADKILHTFDEFLFYILSNLPEEVTLLICSDHGNIEDMSVKMHTRNPALTIAAGKNAHRLANEIKDITQIKNSLLGIIN